MRSLFLIATGENDDLDGQNQTYNVKKTTKIVNKEGKNAIFYTVWSKNTVRKGRGKEVLNSTINAISELPVTRYVTLSPKTEMAVQFHLKNGAVLLSENELTLNFEYKS